jgi:hypothetical protein
VHFFYFLHQAVTQKKLFKNKDKHLSSKEKFSKQLSFGAVVAN